MDTAEASDADLERRRLLASLASRDSASSNKAEEDPAVSTAHEDQEQEDEYSRSRHGKFRFKSSKSKSRSKHDDPSTSDHRHYRRRHHHGHHRSSKRQKTDRDRSASPYSLPNPPLSPNTAFRESLFDALGDDEGAAFWESVYGQPIHNYPNLSVPKGPEGELEQMSEEEYAAYVRARMWERSHEGIMEEQERLRAERAKAKERDERRQRETSERMQFESAMEESLRRGRARRRSKAWKTVWEEYRRSWEELNTLASSKDTEKREKTHLRNLLFWPVESGKRRDVSQEAIEEFVRHAPPVPPPGAKAEDATPPDLLTTLKAERIRWHPDKIQHRYGALGTDESVMRSVTEVFQILDRMWGEERLKRGEK